MKITIEIQNQYFEAVLNDSETAKSIYNVLPIRSIINVWGDEIYFDIPVSAALEADAKTVMQVGELAYYPPMKAFCIFYGPTPLSSGEAPVAAGPVNSFGKLVNFNPDELRQLKDGVEVKISTLG